jgi:hypothetical protein
MSDIETGFEQPRSSETSPATSSAANEELPVSLPEPASYLWHPIEPPPRTLELVPSPPPPSLIPNIGHVLVFVLLILPAMIGGYLVSLLSIYATHPHVRLPVLMQEIGRNVIYLISMQAAIYLVLVALSALVFTLWWDRPFTRGIHWNFAVASRWFLILAALGVVSGLLITLAGNFLPMPKAPPILEDMTKSRAGAFVLMAFGVTLAPLTEELAFRGFLLPSLVNIFRWLQRKAVIGETAIRTVGIPLSILVTSFLFALMHSAQVSNAWGPVLLIGLVSLILCIIRLKTDSVAAGMIVHMFYNLTLFSDLLYQTDFFRHLDKLKT